MIRANHVISGRSWWLATALVLTIALLATVPTTADIGLTWDEPAYRYSQQMSAQWWERLSHARSWRDLSALVDPDALLFYWPYGRYGINFHPPLAGQLNLATHALFGGWVKDIPSRRLASVFEFALTITLAFGFLARRYGPWVGGTAAAALLVMPRVYGDGHIAGTDMPGLLLWVGAALAFWKGIYEPGGRPWRVLVGILVGLSFLEKMAAVVVLLPILGWLMLVRLPKSLRGPEGRAAWIDGLLTTAAMLVPLGIALLEMLRLRGKFPAPMQVDLYLDRPESALPGAILAVPLAVWALRRLLGRLREHDPIWGAERPALEVWMAIVAFAPTIGWLGNPEWWRETLPRLAHYLQINTARRDALPDINILYMGQTYIFSLPWHNGWVLMAITVPVAILAAACIGLLVTLRRARRDVLPLYFLMHFLTLPCLRMLATPAHDGVRLLLPSFFFLAAFAGWGTVGLADALARLSRLPKTWWRVVLATLVLVPSAWQLIKVHPFELSYYNEAIGGPRGAWASGFELSYWYDAFNGQTLAELNDRFPRKAMVDFLNEKAKPPTFSELQSLGSLRSDLVLYTARGDEFPYAWLLTQDAKAWSLSRLLFAMRPWYVRAPRQLDGLRVASVADPVAVSRAWALWLLTATREEEPLPAPAAPGWVRSFAPFLARFWGDGLARVPRGRVNERALAWAREDPAGLRAAAQAIRAGKPIGDDPNTTRLSAILTRFDQPDKAGGKFLERLLQARADALPEAVEILIARPDEIKRVLSRFAYTDAESIGGYLDRGLAR